MALVKRRTTALRAAGGAAATAAVLTDLGLFLAWGHSRNLVSDIFPVNFKGLFTETSQVATGLTYPYM